MGRTKGARNKSPVPKVETKSPVKKKAMSPKKEKKPEEETVFAVPMLEQPLLMCRRCQFAYETQEEYLQHQCAAQVYTVVQETVADMAEDVAEEEETDQLEYIEEKEEKSAASKKPRKPYKKRQKKCKEEDASSKEPVACPTCGKTFTRKYHLERHLIHTSCNPGTIERQEFSCEVCSKVFSRIDNLRMHLRAHLGQKTRSRDFQCPYCEKSFYGSSLLNIHVRTHTRKSKFKLLIIYYIFNINSRRKTISVRLGRMRQRFSIVWRLN